MDQKIKREMFEMELYEFIEPIELTEEFWEQLKKHSQANLYLEHAKEFDDEMAQKCYIFLVFTKTRSTCNEMVKILIDSNLTESANLLNLYNTSPKFIPLSNEEVLHVVPATDIKGGNSKAFRMDEKIRGKALIINNESKLSKESKRFESIFTQLMFDVILWDNLTSDRIREELEELSKSDFLTDNAMIVMFIGHGCNGMIYDINGEKMQTREIIGYFSEEKCQILSKIPKIFFFNCCRNISDEPKTRPESNNLVIKIKQTFTCYSCAEGLESWFEDFEYSIFGQALSHCIAQYSCDKQFVTIMNLTCQRVYDSFLKFCRKSHETDDRLCRDCEQLFDDCIPESREFGVTKELYFNPKLPK